MTMRSTLDILQPHASAYAGTLAKATVSRGLVVTGKDGTRTAIPITATPIVVEDATLHSCNRLSALLGSAGLKMAQAIVLGDRRDLLLSSLSPLERGVVEGSAPGLKQLVISRVDYFLTDRPRALELNATIPAMPAYSDIAAHTFLEIVGAHAGLTPQRIEALKEENGSNTRALFDALLMGYRARKGRDPERLAILVRRGDPQVSELLHFKATFARWGLPTEIVHPDELSGDAVVQARGVAYDFIYRHFFVRRLEDTPNGYVERFLRQQPHPGTVLFNGPAAHVETKTNFALLSQATSDAELARLAGLTDEELAAINEAVPWTRVLDRRPAVGPVGERVANLVDHVAAEPDRFVIKRAWDYGGKAVFVGPARGEPSFEERVEAAYGEVLSWDALVRRAAEDTRGGGFIVQEIVNPVPQKHWICQGEGTVEAELFVDFSAYASVNLGGQPAWGAVCRGSPSRIVNIAGGGAVLPLVRQKVWESLSNALAAPR
jgi:hypothetical protein